MAKVLVTGASGRSGRYIAAELVARGHSVRGQYRSASGTDSWRDMASGGSESARIVEPAA